MRRNSGFTLVEILIVVIILGILAAIVIPQFTEASNEARLSSVTSDLQTLRSQIELYKIQHDDNTPADIAGVTDSATFWGQLTDKTDMYGALDTTDDFGPYLQMIPKNPFLPAAQSQAIQLGGASPDPAAPGVGWWFDTVSNQIKACGEGPDDEDLTTY